MKVKQAEKIEGLVPVSKSELKLLKRLSGYSDPQEFLLLCAKKDPLSLTESEKMMYIIHGLSLGFTVVTLRKLMMVPPSFIGEWASNPDNALMIEKAMARSNVDLEMVVLQGAKEDPNLALKVLSKREKEAWGTGEQDYVKGVKTGISLADMFNQAKQDKKDSNLNKLE